MIFFRNFTTPLWEIFTGQLLLLLCSLLYLAWWIVAFRPGASGGPAGRLYISGAFITGIAAVALMSLGIYSLSRDSGGLPVLFILIGGTVLFLILLPVTSLLFHRKVTSELAIIHIWGILELSAIAVLYSTGHFGTGQTTTLTILTGIATIAGLICYILYYRLDETASYRTGMVPLATDALVMAVFLVILAVS